MATSAKQTPKAKSVSSQITDAVTQTNVRVVAEAPAMALGNTYQAAAHSIGMMYENSISAQNQANIAYSAAIALCVQSLKRN